MMGVKGSDPTLSEVDAEHRMLRKKGQGIDSCITKGSDHCSATRFTKILHLGPATQSLFRLRYRDTISQYCTVTALLCSLLSPSLTSLLFHSHCYSLCSLFPLSHRNVYTYNGTACDRVRQSHRSRTLTSNTYHMLSFNNDVAPQHDFRTCYHCTDESQYRIL